MIEQDINNTNVFSISESIIRDADPSHGSIQKLICTEIQIYWYLQENKIHKALIDKSTIYSGDSRMQQEATR